MLKYKYLFFSNVSNPQADNLHGGHNDVHGQHHVGGHKRRHPHAHQVPGQLKQMVFILKYTIYTGEGDDGSGVDSVPGLLAHEHPVLQSPPFQRGLQREGDEGETLHPCPGGKIQPLGIQEQGLRG